MQSRVEWDRASLLKPKVKLSYNDYEYMLRDVAKVAKTYTETIPVTLEELDSDLAYFDKILEEEYKAEEAFKSLERELGLG